MTDPRGYVRRGEPLAIAATQVNWINDQMRKRDVAQPPADSLGAPYTWVYGKNTSGADAARWAVLTITGVEITPTATDTDTATRQFCTVPVLSLGADTATGKRCVAIEPIKNGQVGRVAIAGVVQVKAADISKLDGATELWKDDNWALIRFGGDPVRLCKTTAAWPRNTKATLHVWESGTPPDEEITTVPVSTEYPDGILTLDAYNKSYDVAACVWVLVGKGKNGKWYLLEAAVPDPTESGACYAPNIGGHDLTTVEGYASNKKQALTHDENACLKWVDIEECSS